MFIIFKFLKFTKMDLKMLTTKSYNLLFIDKL